MVSQPSMESSQIRAESVSIAEKAGILVSATLPLLDAGLRLRDLNDVLDRLLCLAAVAAASYGFSKTQAIAWLQQEEVMQSLTGVELRFLERDEGQPQHFQTQIEGMWALAWALSMVPRLDFWKNCDDDFVAQLPNLKTKESAVGLRDRVRLRPKKEVATACDLAYCLHWAVRQAGIDGRPLPSGLRSYVIVERRRALEWLLSDCPWDEIPLDT